MQPGTTSLLTIALLAIGIAAAVFILEAQGRPKTSAPSKAFTLAHRVCGYGFIFLFAGLWGIMVYRSRGYQPEFSPRILLHIALAAAMAALLFLKIPVARRYRRFYSHLPAIGGLLLVCTVVTTAITAGIYFLQQYGRSPAASALENRPAQQLQGWQDAAQLEDPQALVEKKCAFCHPLDRIYRSRRSEAEWGAVVDRMAENAEEMGEYGLWTLEERNIIVRFLAVQ